MSTNAVAECAGLSVGSLYQYFPNKDSLLAALRTRHAEQMSSAIELALSGSTDIGLRKAVAKLVRAAVAAHEVEPELHRVLEKELPFFEESSDMVGPEIHRHIKDLLKRHRDEIAQKNLELAAWMTMRMTESLVHAAVLDAPKKFRTRELEAAVTDAIVAFLTHRHEA